MSLWPSSPAEPIGPRAAAGHAAAAAAAPQHGYRFQACDGDSLAKLYGPGSTLAGCQLAACNGKIEMSRLYGPTHRSLQDRFDTRRLADNVETRIVLTEIPPEHKAFIESRDMFFLSTIDHQGRPTVSYKGGDPGFVRVLDSKTLAFPCYDGNGMFYSMGNILGNCQVGMLFINFEKPHRLRVQGIASVVDNDPLLKEYAEVQLVARVMVTEIFRNCPRYVHRYKKIQPSEFVPRSTCETPLAPWKRVDDVQASLPAHDRARVEREGSPISRAEYEKYMTDIVDGER
jgi:predicted pyridoxine 5'-phosphate oxidase superfamily flavin-nucleotide-binding protein